MDDGNNTVPSDPRLRRLVSLLMAYQPEKILLFGSHARGQADEFSDYDILVIKRTESSFLERLQEMVPFLVAFDRPAEILVYTPDEYERMGESGLGWIARSEGIVLYERQPPAAPSEMYTASQAQTAREAAERVLDSVEKHLHSSDAQR
jgi:predicted nucleotidyltransferase